MLVGLLLVACYRDSAPPIANTLDPNALVIGGGRSCGPHDDLSSPPLDPSAALHLRLRTHIRGVLAGASGRAWAGDPIPPGIPDKLGTLELFVLDAADGGWLALYREPYNLGSCQLSGTVNCAYEVRFYAHDGAVRWSFPLARLLSRPDHLEVQDLRLVDGVLYFNEACQSYSAEARGACSALVAVDPQTSTVRWRTPPLVSNGRFRIRGCYLVAGYGFTDEADTVSLVDRETGRVIQRIGVSTAPEAMTLVARDRLDVQLSSGITRKLRLDGFDTASPALVALDKDAFGGVGYGGAAYGGATYGRP